ncbi:MAG: PDZ domain-containing protein [Pirellulaceae bacterium]
MHAKTTQTTGRQAISVAWLGMRFVVGSLAVCFLMVPSNVDGQDVSVTPLSKQSKVERSPAYWVEQLQDEKYLRRETASKRLIEAGEAAVPALAAAIREGDLETTTRAVRVLSDLALHQAPDDEQGAWEVLTGLAAHSTGSRQAAAKNVVREIEDAREITANEKLTEAGVVMDYDNFAIGALTSQRFTLRIDERWNGDVQPLGWLRWVRGVQFVSLHGAGIDARVLKQVVRMPRLSTIAMIDGSIDNDGINALAAMPRIDSLEIRYVKLTPEMADMIAKLPIRESLNLMGTGVSAARMKVMESELPGLAISHKEGGFLGVTCSTYGMTRCEITTVTPGSAAYKSGIRRADVVVEIDGEAIELFADLQRVIAKHDAGDKLKFVLERRGVEQVERVETTVELGRHLD